jgi:uncharacterized protein YebE (UPF0316 family)
MDSATVQPVLIAVLVVLEVAVWQVRVALATRGRKRSAAVLGAVNAVLSVVALGQVVTNLDRPANVAGYAVGVAAGVYLGVVADGRFAGDPVEYRVVVPGDGARPADDLRARSWPVTTQPAAGRGGPATVLSVVVEGGRTAEVERDLAQLAPGAFRSSVRLRSATMTLLPPGRAAGTAGAQLLRTVREPDADPAPA